MGGGSSGAARPAGTAEALARTGAGAVDYSGMAQAAARRGHPQCACCALPVAARAEVARRGRRGESLRAISDWLVSEGHAIGKDGVANHLDRHVGAVEKPGGVDQQTRAVLVATAACDVLQRWPGLAQEVADRLRADGLLIEADVVLSVVPETMRRVLDSTEASLTAVEESPAGAVLAARCLALAVGRVLSKGHEAAAREIAAELARQGADILADDLLWLASKAAQNTAGKATP